jgi:hypothetical protein
MSIQRTTLLQQVASTISDYRRGEVEPRTPAVVDRWVRQFPVNQQEAILSALAYTLDKAYVSRDDFKAFLSALASSDKLSAGSDPSQFWRSANLLDIQLGGNSQKDLLAMFDDVLQEQHGFGLSGTGSNNGTYIYLDDCIGTGTRVRNDVCAWIESVAPANSILHIITAALYEGAFWIDQKIQEAASANSKQVTIHKWRLDGFDLENRRSYRNDADVLWPATIPNDPHAEAYAANLTNAGHAPLLRAAGSPGRRGLYSSDEAKLLLEDAFLVRGCQIRAECQNLPERVRPLGYHTLDNFGFGSMFITFRNCPNNTPLALWVQQAEYPALLPRKTNSQAAAARTIRGFF